MSDMWRHTDPDESEEAAKGVQKQKDIELVRAAFKTFGPLHPDGMTRHEVSEYVVLGHLDPENRELRARLKSIVKRVTDLKDEGVIKNTGEKKGREGLMRMTEDDDDGGWAEVFAAL